MVNMKKPEIEFLNNTFSFQNENHSLVFKIGKGDIPLVEIRNEEASATISLQGAHVLSWRPEGEEEVIWLSEEATFASGKSVRGGIPVCWPWFGAHETNASYPAHGFARTVLWQVTNTQQLSSGETQITFTLNTTQLAASELNKSIQQMWPNATVAEYQITLAKTLKLELTTFNHSDHSITIGQALHTYFKVNDVSNTFVTGLQNKDYLDKTEAFKRKTQTGPITFNTEVDRVYLKTADDILIDDNQRKIMIKKQGSQTTVVWNPWKDVAERMGDLGQDGYLKMLCVESANAADDTIKINPGESHTLFTSYELIKK